MHKEKQVYELSYNQDMSSDLEVLSPLARERYAEKE